MHILKKTGGVKDGLRGREKTGRGRVDEKT